LVQRRLCQCLRTRWWRGRTLWWLIISEKSELQRPTGSWLLSL
jgi:hypothetical protein